MLMDQNTSWVLGGGSIRLFPLLNKWVYFATYPSPGVYAVDSEPSHLQTTQPNGSHKDPAIVNNCSFLLLHPKLSDVTCWRKFKWIQLWKSLGCPAQGHMELCLGGNRFQPLRKRSQIGIKSACVLLKQEDKAVKAVGLKPEKRDTPKWVDLMLLNIK